MLNPFFLTYSLIQEGKSFQAFMLILHRERSGKT